MTRPPRVQLIRKDAPSQVLAAQYNPVELTETFGADWSRLKVLGYSGSVKQFSASKDHQLKFTLQFAAKNFGRAGVEQLKAHRKLLKSWCKPRREVSTVDTAGAPEILFVWPNFFSMVAVIDSVTFKSTLFNTKGEPIEAAAEVTLEQILHILVTTDDDDEEALNP